jgi:hypothetical protein
MSERESALATLQAIASSPDAVAESQAHLFAAIDAMVAVFCDAHPEGLTPRQIAMRSRRATWCAVMSHAEHRVHAIPTNEGGGK